LSGKSRGGKFKKIHKGGGGNLESLRAGERLDLGSGEDESVGPKEGVAVKKKTNTSNLVGENWGGYSFLDTKKGKKKSN